MGGKACGGCGSEFTPKRSNTLYCSADCKRDAQIKMRKDATELAKLTEGVGPDVLGAALEAVRLMRDEGYTLTPPVSRPFAPGWQGDERAGEPVSGFTVAYQGSSVPGPDD